MRRQGVGRIVFLVSLVFFLIASNYLAEWYVYHQMGFDNNFRFEDGAHVKGDVLDLYVDYAAKQKGYKIAVVGDSVVQGANVPGREQTVTAHLEEALRGSYLPGARVFNFGLPGGRPADLFMAVKRLHEAGAAQLFVINISYPFFSDEMSANPLLYHKVWRPMLTEEQVSELKLSVDEPAEAEMEQPVEDDSVGAGSIEVDGDSEAERFFQKKVAECWAVYRFRQEINRFIFGGRPAEKGKEFFDSVVLGRAPAAAGPVKKVQAQQPLPEKDKPENKYNVWYSFAWSEQDLGHLRRVFNVTGWDNVNTKYYLELCRYLEENDIPAVVFMSPVNHALLQQYRLLDYDSYGTNTSFIEQVALQSGLPFFDYQEAVHPDLFHDSLHMLDDGNAAVAGLLSRDLQPIIQGVQADDF